MAKQGYKTINQKERRVRYLRAAMLVLLLFIASVGFFLLYRNDFSLSFLKIEDNDEVKQKEIQGTQIEKTTYTQKICISKFINDDLVSYLSKKLDTELPITKDQYNNDCVVRITKGQVDSNQFDALWQQLYVPVVRFDSQVEDISAESISDMVRTQSLGTYPLIWSSEAEGYINANFSTDIIQSFQTNREVIDKVTENSQTAALIPIQEVTPKLKILTIDGLHPADTELNTFIYPFTEIIWVSDKTEGKELMILIEEILSEWQPESQFKPGAFKTLLLTGHSAVGARQFWSRSSDPTFNPLKGLSTILKDSDLTHISNNSSFAKDCTQKNDSSILCGSESSMRWLIEAGVDLVSLNGSGVLDYGRPNFEKNLQLYQSNDIFNFGGGENQADAGGVLYQKLGDITVSFQGYSLIAPRTYLAGNNFSGIAAADKVREGDGKIMTETLENVDRNTTLKIVEMEWGGEDETISEVEKIYANAALDAGADIVFGTTSHSPKGLDIRDDGLIFYGLGDLLYLEGSYSSGMVVENFFYDGEYIGFKLHPVEILSDLNVRLPEVDKKREILNTVYRNSSIQ